jgi:NADH-quinone oxidoreductase subunit L|tara:strand:+ start:1951 stop:3831 length:1881 start_codon:yes stop_codon:yes gene_type:complete
MIIEIQQILPVLIALPIVGAVFAMLFGKHSEKGISYSVIVATGAHLLLTFILVGLWAYRHFEVINIKEVVLYKMQGYEFFIDLYFDKLTAVYLLVGSIMTFLITIYSSFYMHNEHGYRRFFTNIMFFFFGYNVVILSGNFETLFLGWEILGVSSFLLIAYYRDRYLPVKNAVKVFSIYRVGDIGLILAMWLSHHLWHENITFLKLNNLELVHSHIAHHQLLALSIAMSILLTAVIKSAQFPFSSWLPRAMEGPTPSSAIFYGSLAVHIGAFLLQRTAGFWEDMLFFKVQLVLVGLASATLSTFTARVQSSIKAQVAYSSIAQIGIIFIELALGWYDLALIHFVGNAFLRTYQLLISPSIVTYKIREQFFNFEPSADHLTNKWPKKISYTLYMLSLQEWDLDDFLYKRLWVPIKTIGARLNFLNLSNVLIFFVPLLVGAFCLLYFKANIPSEIAQYIPEVFALIGLILVIKAFTERRSVRLSFTLVLLNHLWVAMAISFNDNVNWEHITIYLSGVLLFGLLGFGTILRLKKLERRVFLNQFYGHSYEHPRVAFFFLLCCLGMAGFPISPTFIGEDLIYSHIQSGQLFLAMFVSLSFIIDGLALIRIYARVFLGPHHKTYHESAYRSS